ncbi:hypothetical protein BH09BAC5_BH09BAC5_02810 [soil metagenome]
MVKQILILLIIVSGNLNLNAQMPVIEADSLMKHYNFKVHRYLDRDSCLQNFYQIDLYGISMFPDSVAKRNNEPEYRVNWSELNIYKNIIATTPREDAEDIMMQKRNRPFLPSFIKDYSLITEYIKYSPTEKLPLKGLRIALDPGHTASDTAMGRLEDKYILLKTKSGKDSIVVSLAEGMLTWKTANALALLLRSEGAEVIMTRIRPDITAFGKTYAQWRTDDFHRTLDSLLRIDPLNDRLIKIKSGKIKDENMIFRYVFRDAELRKRSEIINAFHPDLTVIIHFNVDEKNIPWTHSSTKNYCMTFVGGAFQSGELCDAERRFDFLRLLLTDELEKSIQIAGLTALEMNSELEVPLAKTQDAVYLIEHSTPAGLPGVFCRNLSLTRLVQGTVVYGETLYQDNNEECILLSKKMPFKAEGNPSLTGNGRLDEVVSAYHNSILLWAKSLQ